MGRKPKSESDQRDRGRERREQVLTAAEECFRLRGFHGASMAEISKAAGMSTGHIYHYFESKEAIIAAITERNTDEMLMHLGTFGESDEPVNALAMDVDEALSRSICEERLPLELEMLAESFRNEQIAATIHSHDERKRQQVHALIKRQFPDLDDAEIDTRITLIGALFSGLKVRLACRGELCGTNLQPKVSKLIRALLFGQI